ncbi:C-X-C motif chemokine 13-like [Chamaea fasciata]|uniref:C-X-C motif chemokine 13-like n=1 Tax=Chamaea fasciata TaxID=190680 RepID=UPI00336A1649
MAVRAALLLGVLLVSHHHPGDTAILEANSNLSCRCLKSTRAFIPPEKYSSVEVWPVGSSCRRPEVVIKLKSLKRVCVDPDAAWVKQLLQDLRHLRKKKAPR